MLKQVMENVRYIPLNRGSIQQMKGVAVERVCNPDGESKEDQRDLYEHNSEMD